MKGSKRLPNKQNQEKIPCTVSCYLPDQATFEQLPETSAAAVAVAAIVVGSFPVAVHRLDPAVGLLTPGWPVTVEGGGAETAIGLIAFEKLGTPVWKTLVAAVVVVAAVVAVAAEATQTVCCVNRKCKKIQKGKRFQ